MAVGPTYIDGQTGKITITATTVTETADATYSTNEVDMLNNLKAAVNALISDLSA